MQRCAFAPRPVSSRLTALAGLALLGALAAGCHSDGRIGRYCEGGVCGKPPVDCTADNGCEPPPCVGDACNPAPPPPVCTPDRCDPGCDAVSCGRPERCDGSPCGEERGCDGGSCELDACANGRCEVDACSGLQCAAPSCDGGICQAGVCDGGVCEAEPGCNASFPICARCQADDDCVADREDRLCDRARGRCVECLENSHCIGVERWCVRGDCEECRTDDDCSGSLRCRNGDCGLD